MGECPRGGRALQADAPCIRPRSCAKLVPVILRGLFRPNSRRGRTWTVGLLAAWILTATPALRAAEFYVVRHGWHSGIVVSRADIPAGTWPPGVAERDFAGCRCLELGWGDRKFYTAPKPTALMAVSAALIPGRSVLHVAGFTVLPTATHQWTELVRVPCTREEFARLCRALGDSFARDAHGDAQRLGRGCMGSKVSFTPRRGVTGSVIHATRGPYAKPARAGCRRG